MDKSTFHNKVVNSQRITPEEALWGYYNIPLFELSQLALVVKRGKSGENIFYNRNFHVEPTNICCYECKFCSYRKDIEDVDARDFSIEEIIDYIDEKLTSKTTEVHLVGGVHPNHTLEHYCDVIAAVKRKVGDRVAVKAFSAVEHIHMIEKAGVTYEEGISRLIKAGMDTFTGGGAEIFDEEIRAKICPNKASSGKWLTFHETAHMLGIKSNATMLYGHIEDIEHRIEHLNRLRTLQDKTGGFLSFIPLKYRSANNQLSSYGETSVIDDMRTLAISRIFLDNFNHIKAYPPMFGIERTEQAILFGADDIDGTVNDTTDIYSTAGVAPTGLTVSQLELLISNLGFKPMERDSYYGLIHAD